MRLIVDRMLALVDPARFTITDRDDAFAVVIGGVMITFDPAAVMMEQPLEQLATAIENCIAHDRAQAMLAAVGISDGLLPLWLVAGSSVLAAWLGWSRTERVFRRRLVLSDQAGLAPISGSLGRPARQALGQSAARIRVRAGLAVAERIELPGRPRCIAMMGRQVCIKVEGNPLPDTLIAALAQEPDRSAGRLVACILDHPFIAAAGLTIAGIRNGHDAVAIDVESNWGPLAPVPPAAWRAVPDDADPVSPWRATEQEIAALYRLVDVGRNLGEKA